MSLALSQIFPTVFKPKEIILFKVAVRFIWWSPTARDFSNVNKTLYLTLSVNLSTWVTSDTLTVYQQQLPWSHTTSGRPQASSYHGLDWETPSGRNETQYVGFWSCSHGLCTFVWPVSTGDICLSVRMDDFWPVERLAQWNFYECSKWIQPRNLSLSSWSDRRVITSSGEAVTAHWKN